MQFSDFDIRFTQAFMQATPPADRKIMREHAIYRRDGFQQIIDIIDALDAPVEKSRVAAGEGRGEAMIDRAQEMGIRALVAAEDTDVLEYSKGILAEMNETNTFTISVIDEELAHRQTEQPTTKEQS